MNDTVLQLLLQSDRDETMTVDVRSDGRIEYTAPNGVFVSTSKAAIRMWSKIEAIGKHLEPILQQPLVDISTDYQDSSSLASLTYSRYFSFQFSSIGNLFIANADEVAIYVDESLKQGFADSIAYIESQGFVYLNVSEEELHVPYMGINPRYKNRTWWDRFFGYS